MNSCANEGLILEAGRRTVNCMPDPTPSPETSVKRTGLRARYGRSGLALLLGIIVIGVAALVHVTTGENPWGRDVTKRVSQGLALRPKEFGIIGVWWGCLAATVISVVLLFTKGLWLPRRDVRLKQTAMKPTGFGGLASLMLMALLVGAVWLRAPLLTHSLWNDEEYSMRRHAHGEWEQDKEGRWAFEPSEWAETLFECRAGNNHHLNSAAGKVALSGWHFVTGEPREAFSEAALRTPAFIAGILTLVLVAMLGREMGVPWVGLGAAGLLALHPWHVRYAVEARGYSLMMFFMCLMLLALIRALRTNKTAAWTLFAIAEAGCMLSFAGSLYAVAMINVFAVLECFIRREPRRIGTLIGFNLLGAIPVIIWLLPSVPQVAAYMKRPDALRLGLGWEWVRDGFCHLLSGAHYSLPELDKHLGTSWLQQSEMHPTFLPVVGYVLPVLGIAGLLVALFHSAATRLAIVAVASGGAVAFAHNSLQNSPMVVWHLLYVMIPFVLAVPLACARLVPLKRLFAAPVILTLLVVFGIATSDVRGRIIAHDRQPMRQTVASIRTDFPEAMTAVFGVSDRQTQSYDPRVRVLEKATDLDVAMADAQKEGRPLFVYFCGRETSAQRNPDLMQRVLDPAVFKHVSDFKGLEAMFTYHVYRALKIPSQDSSTELPQN